MHRSPVPGFGMGPTCGRRRGMVRALCAVRRRRSVSALAGAPGRHMRELPPTTAERKDPSPALECIIAVSFGSTVCAGAAGAAARDVLRGRVVPAFGFAVARFELLLLSLALLFALLLTLLLTL